MMLPGEADVDLSITFRQTKVKRLCSYDDSRKAVLGRVHMKTLDFE